MEYNKDYSKKIERRLKTEVVKPKIQELSGPFTCIKGVNGKWTVGLMGNQCVKQEFTTKKAAREYVESKPWELILIAAGIYTEKLLEIKKSKK